MPVRARRPTPAASCHRVRPEAIKGLAAFNDPGTVILLTTATINWGDGTPVQVGLVNLAARTVSGSHTYADDGSYQASVIVTVSARHLSSTALDAVVVETPAPPGAVSAGPPPDGTLATGESPA